MSKLIVIWWGVMSELIVRPWALCVEAGSWEPSVLAKNGAMFLLEKIIMARINRLWVSEMNELRCYKSIKYRTTHNLISNNNYSMIRNLRYSESGMLLNFSLHSFGWLRDFLEMVIVRGKRNLVLRLGVECKRQTKL
jgi:hypothetical protein